MKNATDGGATQERRASPASILTCRMNLSFPGRSRVRPATVWLLPS